MAEVNFELYNNQLVQQLVGASDANLRLIEKILNVEISSFGNQINIKGSQDAVDQAKTAIDLLYGKVSKGIEIGEQEVKAAVRMSEEGSEKIDGQNLNDIVLKTKKRHIYPRSATQAKYCTLYTSAAVAEQTGVQVGSSRGLESIKKRTR